MSRIAIIGAGAWGTGLAIVLGRQGTHQVWLWAHEKEVRDSIAEQHINQLFLPEYPVPASVTCTNDLQQAVDRADIVVGVMPSHHCRKLFESVAVNLKPEMLFVSATKGLENDTLLRMTDVITQVVTTRVGCRLPKKWREVIRPQSPLHPATLSWHKSCSANSVIPVSASTPMMT
jgi:glycerol-3-phosphate dehydrogenase (NAD(P)+)